MLGLAAMLAAGAVAGILYAPHKGRRTRKKLLRKGQEIISRAEDALGQGRDTLEKLRDKLKDQLECVNEEIVRTSGHLR